MLTKKEIDSLARDILTHIVTHIESWEHSVFDEVQHMDNGEEIPVYSASSEESDGSFVCSYMPLEAIKKIISKCEEIYDAFPIEIADPDDATKTITKIIIRGKADPEDRRDAIKTMANCAALHLIGGFRERLCDTLEEAVKDGELIAQSIASAVMAKQLTTLLPAPATADLKQEIDEAAKRVADRKRELLRGHIGKLPNVFAGRGRGRIPKTDAEWEQDRLDYEARVERVYRELRAELGRPPIKTEVAKRIIGGGTTPGGTDSNLTSFDNRLRTLKIDYPAIVAKVERELHG